MLLTEDQLKGLEDGIAEGLRNAGMEFTLGEKLLVHLCVKTTLETVEKIQLLQGRKELM